MGLAETNIAWHLLPPDHRLQERTWGWFREMSFSSSYPREFPAISPVLAGGTTTIAINDSVHRISCKAVDESGMGRWSSIKLQGKNKASIRLISAYRCVRNTKGVLSVWSQQKYILNTKGLDSDPISCFETDLLQALRQWQSDGGSIVLAIDLNGDVRSDPFTFRLQQAGLQEIFVHKYGDQLPYTYSRGSKPIDGLFVSSDLLESKCGYSPIVCDHRMLWMDIPLDIAFGYRPVPIFSRQPNRLKLEDPRVVDRYNSLIHSFYSEHNVYQRTIDLYNSAPNYLSGTFLQEYEAIDRLRLQAVQFATKRCRKLRMGATPYSPKLSMLGKTIRAWSLFIKNKSGKRVDSRYLWRKMKEAGISMDSTLQDAQEALRTTWQSFNLLKKRAHLDRATWIEELAAARAANGLVSVAQEIKNLYTRELQRREARLVRRIKGSTRMGLTSIEVPHHDGVLELTTKHEIEAALCEELSKRFNQAKNSPFLSGTLFEDVGPLGTGPGAKDILMGCYKPKEPCDSATAQLIPFLAFACPPISFPLEWTLAEHIYGWSRVREKTSSGISGITIPHLKAHTKVPPIASVDHILALLPYKMGFSPSRWQKGIDVMIEKKEGLRHISKLQAILLYEADFNQNNKILGRSMIKIAETYNAVALEQYGSRKTLSAIDQTLNKALTFDIWRIQKTCGALCSNDAKSCYDRIVHGLASLAMQRVRVRPEPIVSMFSTIQSLQHHIRTSYGDSSVFFSGKDWDTPIQGVGQGNGAGPHIWALISSPIMNMLREKGYGSHFTSAISGKKFSIIGYGFVDDTDLVSSSTKFSSIEDAAQTLQESVTLWEGGISATGGAIEPAKSFCYAVDFEWKNGEAQYKSIKECGLNNILIRDSEGNLQPLRYLEPWQAERTLGVRLAPDGNMNQQFEYMLDTAQAWVTKLTNCSLPRHLAWLAWKTTILKTLEYPLLSTTLSVKQCNRLTSILLAAVLPRSGIVKSFPRAIAHGPKQFFGLEIPNFYITQGICHVCRLVRYSISLQNPTAILLRHAAEAFKVLLGCNGFLLTQPWASLQDLAPGSWIKSTWEFVARSDFVVEDNIPDFEPWRLNDQLLIPLFLSLGFSGKILHLLNTCRLYLRVTWLSDIVTGDGKRIRKEAFSGKDFITHSHDSIHYPNQGCPSNEAWAIWNTALLKLCNKKGLLCQPLQAWIRDPQKWYFHPYTDRLFLYSNGWTTYQKRHSVRSRHSYGMFESPTPCHEIPRDLCPATISTRGPYQILTGFDNLQLAESRHNKRTSFDHFLSSLPADLLWISQNYEVHGNWEFPTNNICLCAVSDGSYKDGHGTAAFCIQVEGNPSTYIRGCVVTPGRSVEQNAYRSELAGIYAVVVTQWAIASYFQASGSITIACDGKSALHRAQQEFDFVNVGEPHYDIISAIRVMLRRSQWQRTWLHVKGHQDDAGKELDFWAQLNVQMDAAAKQHWKQTFPRSDIEPRGIFGEAWRVSLAGNKVCSDLPSALKNFCYTQPALNYWTNKPRCQGTCALIDWDAIGGAIKRLNWGRRVWITKQVTGFHATGQNMARRQERNMATCPRCPADETAIHFLQCQGSDAETVWSNALNNLQGWLLENATHPAMVECIITNLKSWRYGIEPPTTPQDFFSQACQDQNRCGWRNFLEGMICQQWRIAQSEYWLKIGCNKSIRRWIESLIVKLWNISWDLWEHRNGILHDKTSSILITELHQKITQELSLSRSGLPPNILAIFPKEPSDILKKPLPIKQQWLRRIQLARLANQEQSKGKSQAGARALMHKWLHGSQ